MDFSIYVMECRRPSLTERVRERYAQYKYSMLSAEDKLRTALLIYPFAELPELADEIEDALVKSATDNPTEREHRIFWTVLSSATPFVEMHSEVEELAVEAGTSRAREMQNKWEVRMQKNIKNAIDCGRDVAIREDSPFGCILFDVSRIQN